MKKAMVSPSRSKAKKYLERQKRCFNVETRPRFIPNLVISEGCGSNIKDVDGNVYIDVVSTYAPLGNCHPKVVEAIKRQAKRFMHFYFSHGLNEPALRLAEKLQEIMPQGLRDGKVVYGCTGADAVEYALKLARSYSKKSIIISYLGGHHGRTYGTIPITSDFSGSKIGVTPSIMEAVHVPYPYCYRCALKQTFPECELACLNYIENVLEYAAPPENVAAIVTEAIQSFYGFVVPPDEYMLKLRKLCDKYAIILIDDEVYVGLGRTGRMFACEHWGMVPDILSFGKAVGGCMPLTGFVAKKELVDGWADSGSPIGGASSSNAANPVACAASMATIEVIQREKLLNNVLRMEKPLKEALDELSLRHKLIGDVRGRGILWSIELVKDRESKKPAIEEAEKVVHKSFEKGVLLDRHRQSLRIVPALNVTIESLTEVVEVIDAALMEVEEKI